MTVDKNLNLSVYQYDYGAPVGFSAKYRTGWRNGDVIAFEFDNGMRKEFTVSFSDVPDDEKIYYFQLEFNKQEADALFPVELPFGKVEQIPFSIKQIRGTSILYTIRDRILYVRGTIPCQN